MRDRHPCLSCNGFTAIATTRLYLEQPITWLHRLDPRVKLAWLMSFLYSIWQIPFGAFWWWFADSYNLNSCDSATGMAAANGLAIDAVVCPAHRATRRTSRLSTRLPDSAAAPNPSDYQYVIFQQGPVTITRHSLTLAVRFSTTSVYTDLQHQPVFTHDCTRGNYRCD